MTRREPPSSEITPEAVYLKRRELMRQGALFLGASAAFGGGLLWVTGAGKGGPPPDPEAPPLASAAGSAKASPFRVNEPPTSYQDITHYNNFYEFGLSKLDPAENAHTLKPRPWTIEVSGLVEKPLVLDIETILKWFPLEERVYRMRCVEAWSMVIPWLGFPLGALIAKLKPTSAAKYVAFQTLLDEEQMPLTKERVLEWPYVEGLRLDEAMHPLTLLAVGLYGKTLPNQNGAPIRLVVPWKYGFKGIKSIVKIRFTDTEPVTTWSRIAPKSYGFYANVNPHVSHPRWSQGSERRIGDLERRATLLFNGYADEVASLYKGMDLARYY
ncbi:MAG TPA: protein-methionine-sulfoxide reductase catalytic subunit MsrP [Polyangiaceae bacterium]|nr:protein-methionine-sulfoxide reductase catalytic subunit MsrP [Polyangiaceae bacterium]